ncbi:hypothetical protein [Trinickia diaoshuihuensis]|uniref:hypothetical protein n=1 Tax=Trinickia diaoshuihuensis TaxID=2292265 RepID=UPI001967BA93|nr:hypothetical protein [Trinickia diaoshuihuensis]
MQIQLFNGWGESNCRSGQGGVGAALTDYLPALHNLFSAGNPPVQEIATHWGEWRDGVPQR